MTGKTILGVLGLLLLGMLCGPVTAELCAPVTAEIMEPDSWNFSIVNEILWNSDDTFVELNGQRDFTAWSYQKIYVSNTVDQVTVHFVVTEGAETTLTITRDYIDNLRNMNLKMEPTLHAWGGALTYDVDAGWMGVDNTDDVDPDNSIYFMANEHLKKRGLVHDSTNGTKIYPILKGKLKYNHIPGKSYGVYISHVRNGKVIYDPRVRIVTS